MLPILFSIGPVPVSSFGLFLGLGFLAAMFVSWRIAKAYDIDQAKILDLGLLTFFGGLIFARIYFVLFNLNYFNNISYVFLINLYPGLSLWGGLIGGALTLKLLAARAKLNFWQIADLATVGLMMGLVFGSIGCTLGGCGYGVTSSLPIAVSVVGLIGKRLPVPFFEALIYLMFFFWLWKSATRFHFNGKIMAIAFMLLGAERFFADYFREGDWQGQLAPLALFIIGFVIFYLRAKRAPTDDIFSIIDSFSTSKKRNLLLQRFIKHCYNSKIQWKIKLGKTRTSLLLLPNKIKRKLNVKSTPRNYH
ncbi:MAG: prolipoprotein diacylglyceryl transferase [Candidatus Daviesbacteria bacterium]|nr:prolipoprotein diacylglyceryl transferase [Candidatus Daviesbacteria bacterium]